MEKDKALDQLKDIILKYGARDLWTQSELIDIVGDAYNLGLQAGLEKATEVIERNFDKIQKRVADQWN